MTRFPFQSLFTDRPERRWVSGPGASGDWRIKPTSLLDDDADPRFPAFQQAWQQGAGLGELFGPTLFDLHGVVAPSGGDNTRPDVAKVQTLLGRSDYQDAVTHFRGEVARDRVGSMPYLAAVHKEMVVRDPGLAGKFATQMRAAGLTEDERPPSHEDGSSPDGGPGWYVDENGRLVIIITKEYGGGGNGPGDGTGGSGSGQGGDGNDGGDPPPVDAVPGDQESKDNGQCRQLSVNLGNAELHYQSTSKRFHEAVDQVKELRRQLDEAAAKRETAVGDALGSAAGDCLAAGAAAGATTKGGWPAKLSAAAIACIKANLKPEKGFDLGDILSHDYDVGQIERDLAEAVRTQQLMQKELDAAYAAMREAQGALSQTGCSGEGVS
ncbi:MAG: hypothetical protein HYU59_00450 [Magnetospirillum gryphiswaldense]|nr:hypothetical protein [Magnetospirillum gryphiswaldense]